MKVLKKSLNISLFMIQLGTCRRMGETIMEDTGSQPKGNSCSMLLPIPIHQQEMPFNNPQDYTQWAKT